MSDRFRSSALAIAIAALAAGGAVAQTGEPEPRLIVKPVWLKRPTGADLAAHYPEKAMAAALGGQATIVCRVNAKGRLGSCKLLSEDPQDHDFGKAVLRLSAYFVMAAVDGDGLPTDGALTRVTLVYKLPGSGG